VHGYRNVTSNPLIFVPIHVSGWNHTQYSKEGGVETRKNLVHGPVCWATMLHFWKSWKYAFWPPPGCQESFSLLSGHALSSIMVWNAGDGPWWAATVVIKKSLVSPSEHNLIQQTMPDELFDKIQPILLLRKGSKNWSSSCQLSRPQTV